MKMRKYRKIISSVACSVLIFVVLFSFLSNLHAEKKDKKGFNEKYPKYEFGTYLYNHTINKYTKNPEKIAHVCSEIGLTEVYLSFSKKKYSNQKESYTNFLNKLIKKFHQLDIKVFVLEYSSPIIIFDTQKIKKISSLIKHYNKNSPKESRFDAVSVDLEPHMLDKKNANKWGKLPYYWTDNGYASNNLKLLKKTFSALNKIKESVKPMVISEAFPAFYIKNFKPHIKKSSVTQMFLENGCDFVNFMAYSNSVIRVVDHSYKAVKSSNKKNSVNICIKTSSDTKGGGGKSTTFSGITRSELFYVLKKIISNVEKFESFRGIAFFEYEGLKKIWNNTKEKNQP